MENLVVNGGKALKGKVKIGGSKNAVLPIMAASILSNEPTVLTNVPDISDVHTFCQLLEHLGAKTSYEKGTLTIDPSKVKNRQLPDKLVCKMRASILLAGPLLARFGEVNMPYPGGCVLGKRSVSSHVIGFQRLGAKPVNIDTKFHLKAKKLHNDVVILPEFSVTATENVIMAAALLPKTTQVRIAACEPHVQDLCHFLVKMGCKIDGIGTHTITIRGKQKLKGVKKYKVISDYLQAGTYLLAGVVTKGEVTVTNMDPEHLDIFFEKLEEIGVKFERGKTTATVYPSKNLKAIEHLKTGVHPNFPTDLQAPFSIALTQAKGVSKVFETLFEGRFQYLFELERMGAHIELLNPHQAIIIGANKLKGAPVASCDIRAGAAMVLAALAAEGETMITSIQYIDRGYENLEANLTNLGADIRRVKV